MSFNIAIDGPAGAGKSTIARKVARELSYIYVDTGAMYRAIALYFINNNISLEDETKINSMLNNILIDIKYENEIQQIYLNGENVTDLIRTGEVSHGASVVSTYKLVRIKLVELQQEFAKNNNVVMDGRDIGTVVLPKANVKIFLTASIKERALRRYKELIEKGENPDLEVIKEEIAARDYRDTHRENSPLIKADDAYLLDSSNMTIDEEVKLIINKCIERE